MQHEWPGNVRELENIVERAVIVARGEMITPMEIPENLKELDLELMEPRINIVAGRSLKEVEKEMILRTLGEIVVNRTLQLKLKEYGINPS